MYIHTHIITIRNTAGSAEQCKYDYIGTTDHISCIARVTRFQDQATALMLNQEVL